MRKRRAKRDRKKWIGEYIWKTSIILHTTQYLCIFTNVNKIQNKDHIILYRDCR